MIQPRTQTHAYWEAEFALDDSDIEQIYNHFLDVERPQTTEQLANMAMTARMKAESSQIKRLLKGHQIYQPQKIFSIGDKIVFPSLNFSQSEVTAARAGNNPQYGEFSVIAVEINGKPREFSSGFKLEHPLNDLDVTAVITASPETIEDIIETCSDDVTNKIDAALKSRDEFVKLGGEWFVVALMPEVNAGHLHLASAILEMYEGGPLPAGEVLPHLDMAPGDDPEAQRFAFNHAMLADDRFDEVAPVGEVKWFLRSLEPEGVAETPERLVYEPIPYHRTLINLDLGQLERELDDEWSAFEDSAAVDLVVFSLTFPHRWAGTIPFSSRIRPLFPPSSAPRQRVVFIDEFNKKEIVGWIVRDGRYIFGLKEWYEENNIPVGGFVHLKKGDESGKLILGYDKRRPKREWARLASENDGRIHFKNKKRAIGCGYDDLLNVGTDTVAAIDALWKRADAQNRSIASLLAEVFRPLLDDDMNIQRTVHAKTLYSAVNLLRRIPPAPLFAELVRHPAFQEVGDHYWTFDNSRWQKEK